MVWVRQSSLMQLMLAVSLVHPAVGNYTQIDRDGIRINNGIRCKSTEYSKYLFRCW